MPRVLVTGATGFIGPHVVDRLERAGAEVACLVRPSSRRDALSPFSVEFRTGDVTDPASLDAALDQIDIVLHLAGLTKAFRPDDYRRVNAEGCSRLAQACARRTSPPTLILVSSLAAAGPAPSDRPRTEHDQPQPISHYGRSKRSGELAAAEFAGHVPLSVVRPPIVFGAGDRDFLRLMRPIARFGWHPVPGVSASRYSLIHAADLAEAIWLSAVRGARLARDPQSDPHVGYYFVAHPEHPTYVELGHRIAQAVGRERLRVLRAPAAAAWLAGGVSEIWSRLRGQPAILNWDKAREALAGSWTCDPSRAMNELGFQPAHSLDERLAQTAAWYIDRGWLPAPTAATVREGPSPA